MEPEKVLKAATFEEIAQTNRELEKIYAELTKQTKIEEKPSGIADRVFIDLFGFVAIYLLLFFTCDITRSIVLGQDLFGLKWLFFGPYYFFTCAPLMTRIWKSKKFLEDLSEAKDGIEYDPSKTCTHEGHVYELACKADEDHPHQHPLRDHLGSGLDWVIRHTLGKAFGGVLGNATCQDQADTIARDCADSRVTRAYNAYTFLCSQYGVSHIASINLPNTSGSANDQTRNWDDGSKVAYQAYYDVYVALYDIGLESLGNDDRPKNLNPRYDSTNNYCYNAATVFRSNLFYAPPWFVAEGGFDKGPCYFQDNYERHLLDYWDPVS